MILDEKIAALHSDIEDIMYELDKEIDLTDKHENGLFSLYKQSWHILH